ncbi:DNA adenine methylase [Borrelia hermsii]|uniref:Site-specific DNA-methyltransferase (adenine-specific) n=3 Tax=Borrelia hermsii TaxID=140 RepID=A0AAN0X5J5_BORHE|nr:DNA adenine methylase [Borrelia hermsii]ANA43271.1 DNA methyltransferase [Borrelia hermsii HS1]UPA08167.1 DNA adenine methylase [Borrelia hermsii DAH]
MNMSVAIRPVLKWAGGKKNLLKVILNNIPLSFNNYIEPFVGGGALFFALNLKNSIINDINSNLINFYREIAYNLDNFLLEVEKYNNAPLTKEHYVHIRNSFNNEDLTNLEKACIFLYLNKTCYNGLYRENGDGRFNTPFGKYKKISLYEIKNLQLASKLLREVKVLSLDFFCLLDFIKKDDFVYLDPPYIPYSKTSNFTNYSRYGFDVRMHEKLLHFCEEIDKKGAKFLLSNSNTAFSLGLYKNYNVAFVDSKRFINANPGGRGSIREILVKNF